MRPACSCRCGTVQGVVVGALTGYQGVMTTSQLVRPRSGKMIAGVCAALGNRFGISTGLIRIAFVIFGLVGAGELAYIICWIVIPKEQ